MRVDLFDYHLPEERIAHEPAARREAARLMVLPGAGGVEHAVFADLPGLLAPGDLLVLNDTRVLPARLAARRPSGGRVEVLLLEPDAAAGDGDVWRALLRASRRPRPGERIRLPGGGDARVIEDLGNGEARLALEGLNGGPEALMRRHGRLPLPPYVRRGETDCREAIDRERYQTVYARNPGAVAAPTAGLHFSLPLLEAAARRGVDIARLTLHVGVGTFRPVTVARVEDHALVPERFEIGEETADKIAAARRRGGRVIACGTTVVRTLESRAAAGGGVSSGTGRCGLFIVPGHRFRVVDALITNFHLPRSTLLMLVAAFAGRERVLAAYRAAIAAGYRFYSYGDAMYIPPPAEAA